MFIVWSNAYYNMLIKTINRISPMYSITVGWYLKGELGDELSLALTEVGGR